MQAFFWLLLGLKLLITLFMSTLGLFGPYMMLSGILVMFDEVLSDHFVKYLYGAASPNG